LPFAYDADGPNSNAPLLVAGEQLYQIFSYITKILINVKSQYVNKTLHVFLRTLPGNLQGPQTCACIDIEFQSEISNPITMNIILQLCLIIKENVLSYAK